MSASTAAAMASRAWSRSWWWCSQPAWSRSSWLSTMSPARKPVRAWRSTGSAWRRFTVSSATGTWPRRTWSAIQAASPPGADRLGLEGVADHPHHAHPGRPPRRPGRHGLRGWAAGRTRRPPPHDPASRRLSVEGEAGHRHGRDADLAELVDGLVGRRHGQHRPSRPAGGVDGGGEGGGLAVPGRGDQSPQRRTRPAQHADRGGLVVAQPAGRRRAAVATPRVERRRLAVSETRGGAGPGLRGGGGRRVDHWPGARPVGPG